MIQASKKTASAGVPAPPRPGPQPLKEATVDTKSVAEETRKRGECSGCGRTDKALTAPKPNVGRGYRGEMFCISCNPRFSSGAARFLDAHYTCLERLVG